MGNLRYFSLCRPGELGSGLNSAADEKKHVKVSLTSFLRELSGVRIEFLPKAL